MKMNVNVTMITNSLVVQKIPQGSLKCPFFLIYLFTKKINYKYLFFQLWKIIYIYIYIEKKTKFVKEKDANLISETVQQ